MNATVSAVVSGYPSISIKQKSLHTCYTIKKRANQFHAVSCFTHGQARRCTISIQRSSIEASLRKYSQVLYFASTQDVVCWPWQIRAICSSADWVAKGFRKSLLISSITNLASTQTTLQLSFLFLIISTTCVFRRRLLQPITGRAPESPTFVFAGISCQHRSSRGISQHAAACLNRTPFFFYKICVCFFFI